MDAQGRNAAPVAARLKNLLVHLAGLLSDPTASGDEVDFGMFLLANSGAAVEPGTERAILQRVYVPFWTSLIQLAAEYPDAVARLPWPPTPVTAYRHATHDIYSGKYRPTISGLLEDWSTLRVPSTGDAPEEASSQAIKRIVESIETARQRSGMPQVVIRRAAEPPPTARTRRTAQAAVAGPTPNSAATGQPQVRSHSVAPECDSNRVVPAMNRVGARAAPPPNDTQIYEAVRQQWRRLIHGYDEREAGKHPTMAINVNTPSAVLRMLKADGFHFRRNGNLLIMY